jgi:MraZ protein
MTFPSRYRERLVDICHGRLVVTNDAFYEPCLRIYPQSDWEVLQQQVMALSGRNSVTRKFQEQFVGQAEDCEMDGSGRILVPQLLRDRVKLEKRLALVGLGNHFELWDETLWTERQQVSLAELSNTEEGQETLAELAKLPL